VQSKKAMAKGKTAGIGKGKKKRKKLEVSKKCLHLNRHYLIFLAKTSFFSFLVGGSIV